jgi:hypothetical protein
LAAQPRHPPKILGIGLDIGEPPWYIVYMEQTTKTKPIELIVCAGCGAMGTVDDFDEYRDRFFCPPCADEAAREDEGERIYEMMRDREMGF